MEVFSPHLSDRYTFIIFTIWHTLLFHCLFNFCFQIFFKVKFIYHKMPGLTLEYNKINFGKSIQPCISWPFQDKNISIILKYSFIDFSTQLHPPHRYQFSGTFPLVYFASFRTSWNETIQCVIFCVQLLSRNITSVRECVSSRPFFFITK